MYDPEEAMAEEERINTVREIVADIEDQFGDKYPHHVRFYQLIGECFERLHQLSQDLDNCFDDEEREKISKEARDLMVVIDKAMNDRLGQIEK